MSVAVFPLTVLLGAVAAAPVPLATPPARVVLVSLSGSFSEIAWPAAEARLEAELEAMGFAVDHAEAHQLEDTARRLELEQLAAGREALAAMSISVAVADQASELWVVDRVTGKTSIRRLAPTLARASDAATTAALRGVELLHASLLESRLAHESRGVVPVPPRVESNLRTLLSEEDTASPWWVFGVGVFVAHLSPKLPQFVGPSIEGRVHVRSTLQIVATLDRSVTGTRLERAGAVADTTLTTARLGISYTLFPHAFIIPAAGVDLGLLAITADGWAESPLQGRKTTGFVAAPGITFGGTYKISSQVAIEAALHGAAPMPRSGIYFDGAAVARLAPVVVSALVMLSVTP